MEEGIGGRERELPGEGEQEREREIIAFSAGQEKMVGEKRR